MPLIFSIRFLTVPGCVQIARLFDTNRRAILCWVFLGLQFHLPCWIWLFLSATVLLIRQMCPKKFSFLSITFWRMFRWHFTLLRTSSFVIFCCHLMCMIRLHVSSHLAYLSLVFAVQDLLQWRRQVWNRGGARKKMSESNEQIFNLTHAHDVPEFEVFMNKT